jgi:hypothetical protein
MKLKFKIKIYGFGGVVAEEKRASDNISTNIKRTH